MPGARLVCDRVARLTCSFFAGRGGCWTLSDTLPRAGAGLGNFSLDLVAVTPPGSLLGARGAQGVWQGGAAFQHHWLFRGAPDPIEMIRLLPSFPASPPSRKSLFILFYFVSWLRPGDTGRFSAKPLPGQIKETH